MASPKTYNSRSSSVKRLLAEARELANLAEDGIYAAPLEENLHEFHFCIRGPQDSEFEGGLYHGRIILPPQYPFKAPDIMLMTPNGRFELNKKVCLTITGFHEESWQPAWGIRTALVGLSSFFQTEAKGAIGGLDTSVAERKRLALLSKSWTCPTCSMSNEELLPPAQPKLDKGKGKAEEPNSAETEEPKAPADELPQAADASPKPTQPIAVAQPAELSTAASEVVAVPSTPARQSPAPLQAPSPRSGALSADSSHESPIRPQEHRPVQVMDLLSAQLGGLGVAHQPRPATRTVAIAAGGNSERRDGLNGTSPPPVWLDGAIGLVLVALASLLCRKVL